MSAALAVPLTTNPAGAQPAARPHAAPAAEDQESFSDNLVPKWRAKYERRNAVAVEQRLRHGGSGDSERIKRGVHGRVGVTGKDRIFVMLVEYGKTRHSAYCDQTEETAPDTCAYPSDGTPQRYNGPLHNQIPEPDRSVDNSTLWDSNYDRAYYRNMYFERMRKFYEDQSMGKYTFEGDVSAWVKVPFNQARYGRDFCGDVVCTNTWFLLRDGLSMWTQGRLAAGWTMADVRNYLAEFDIEDRYDFDGDGDFREPDGYIDHMQVVHAGGDQADADPVYGSDAIWSHRWNAVLENVGGPEGGAQIGGFELGEGGVSDPTGANVTLPDNPTGIWVNDYTIQPENGGLSVFAHEYGHDLGLPDHYDTSGNAGGAENSTGFWTLMSQSRGTAKGDEGIGDRPMPFWAWDKFRLGWLDYGVARAGRDSKHRLRPAQSLSDRARNGVIVLLPDKKVPLELGAPCEGCGERYYYSDAGDDLDNTMTTEVDGGGQLTAQVRYEIEEGWDYAFLEVSQDDGTTWDSITTNHSYSGEDFSGFNPDDTGITGSSDGWETLTATVPAGTDLLRWRYRTDGAFALEGFQVDEITLDGEVIGDAETDEGWQFDGFRTTTGSEIIEYLNAYIVENRQHKGRDKLLDHVYNFGFELPDKVKFYSYEPGALITYWDTSQSNNNVGDHPGQGEVLPVDAHPTFDHNPDGTLVRPRTMAYDATFSKERATGFDLHYLGERFRVNGSPAVPRFDDTLDWWYDFDEHADTGEHEGRYQPGWYSVDVPKTGTVIQVKKVQKDEDMLIKVTTSE